MNYKNSATEKDKGTFKIYPWRKPDYNYLKSVFKYIRKELEIDVPRNTRELPYVPTED